MTTPTNGITPEVFREVMPPYQLSADLLAAMFAAVRAPPPDATIAWRQERAGRLVQEMAGLMPADAPQARIAAQIVIVREATDDSFAWANAPGLTVEQACRLRRTAGALTNSAAALERTLARHQQKPVPFFGTVLDDGIDVAVLAAEWGGPGSRRDDAGNAGGGGGATDGAVGVGMAAIDRGNKGTRRAVTGEAATSGDCGESPDGSAAVGMAGTGPAMTGGREPASVSGSGPVSAPVAVRATPPATTAERQDAPRPRQDAEATSGVVTRLDQGPGWTLDVVHPRTAGDNVRPRTDGEVATGVAPEPVA